MGTSNKNRPSTNLKEADCRKNETIPERTVGSGKDLERLRKPIVRQSVGTAAPLPVDALRLNDIPDSFQHGGSIHAVDVENRHRPHSTQCGLCAVLGDRLCDDAPLSDAFIAPVHCLLHAGLSQRAGDDRLETESFQSPAESVTALL